MYFLNMLIIASKLVDNYALIAWPHTTCINGGMKLLPCQLNIAVDGPAGAGKSSVARAVAENLGLIYLDTGAMYRAITWKAMDLNLPLEDAQAMGKLAAATEFTWHDHGTGRQLFMDSQPLPSAIRSREVTRAVSLVSSYEPVRKVLRNQQRALCADNGVIMDGRDIGTAVMPDADLKIFLTASLQERARRRLQERGQSLGMLSEVMQEMAERDRYDSTRAHSPLCIAADAIVIDTTGLSLTQVVDSVVGHAQQICQSKGG